MAILFPAANPAAEEDQHAWLLVVLQDLGGDTPRYGWRNGSRLRNPSCKYRQNVGQRVTECCMKL